MKSFSLRSVLVSWGFIIVSCGLAYADTSFILGNHPSGDVNILLSSAATGTTVQGAPNGFPQITVNFISSQVLREPSSGQARVSASLEGTPLTNLMISLANNATYGDLIINPFIGGQCPDCVFGPATITVHALSNTGMPEPEATFIYDLGNGNNFLTIVATGGERIVSTSISAPGGFNDLRQPRISGPFVLSVPEPASLYTLVCSLVGLALVAFKQRRM